MSNSQLVLFLRLTRPLFLLGGVLLYALGVGIARYLGTPIDWDLYWLGQIWVTLLQLGTHYLNEYFDSPADLDNPNRTPFTGGSGAIGPGKLTRNVALVAALTCLAFTASLSVVLLARGIPTLALFLMIASFFGAFFYSVPPVRLESTGYGELIASLIVAFLLPAYAFSLQTGNLHPLIPMSTFPLVILHLAMLLAFDLPDYSNDTKFEKRTMLVRMGWQSGMFLHNLLILTAYLLLALATIIGLPFFAAFPAVLTLPLGILQIWQFRRVAAGLPPNWKAITLNALVLFAGTAYLITYAFWTH